MLTVKESLADSGRSSGASQAQTQQLLAAPSDILREHDVPAHFGTFYLRLGTVSKWRTGGSWSPALQLLCSVFGIGGIIYVGIEMGGLFTLGLHSNNLITCGEIFNILRPSLQIVFIFMQMHFVFLNHKMKVFRRPLVTRLGLMQLVVTNVSIWLRALVTETVEAGGFSYGDRQARATENMTGMEIELR